jgi:hypothetical protein
MGLHARDQGIGLACLALHLAGYGTGWGGRSRR